MDANIEIQLDDIIQLLYSVFPKVTSIPLFICKHAIGIRLYI